MGPHLMRSDEYDAMRLAEDGLWWYVGLRDAVMHELRKACGPPARILDVGCGTGRNLEEFGRAGYQACGLDLSRAALLHSRSRGLASLHLASTLHIPFRDRSFDAAVCLDVLGILGPGDQVSAVREILRVLRPGGVLVIHAAAYEWLRSSHDDVINWQTRFTRTGLLGVLREAGGAECARCTYRVTLLFPPVAAVKLAKKWLARSNAEPASDQHVTPGALNGLLKATQLFENRVLRHCDAPFGSSVLLVARKTQH